MPISAIHDETQMRDGYTGRAWPVRAEGSSCVVTSGLWPGQRLRHDNTQRKDTYTETGDILLIFEWQVKRGTVLLGPVSSNNKQDQSSPACNTNIQRKKEIFLQFLLLPSFAVLSLLKLVTKQLVFHAHFKLLSPYFVASKEFCFTNKCGHRIQIPRLDCPTYVIMLSRLVNFTTCARVNQPLIEFPVNECYSSS